MAKIFKIILTLVLTVVVVLLIAPMFYSVDELRPRIQKAANKQIQGRVELGALSFSLFPSVSLGVEKIRLFAPNEDKEFGQIELVEVNMPLWSLIAAPSATLSIQEPRISWVKNESKGIDNIASFLPVPSKGATEQKSSQQNKADETEATEAPQGLKDVLASLPGWIQSRILAARFSFEVVGGEFNTDWSLKGMPRLQEKVTNLEASVDSFGLNTQVPLALSCLVQVEMDTLKANGPVEVTGGIKVDLNASEKGVGVDFQLRNELSALSISALPFFSKDAGKALAAEIEGSASVGEETTIKLKTLSFELADMKTVGALQVKLVEASAPQIDLSIDSQSIDISNVASLIPMVRNYQLQGNTQLNFSASGSVDNLALNGAVKLRGLGGSTPVLAQPIRGLKGDISIGGTSLNPQIKVKDVSFEFAKSDLLMNAEINGLGPFQIGFDVRSKNLFVDQFLAEGMVATPGAKSQQTGKPLAGAGAVTTTDSGSLDQSLEELAPVVEEALQNEMLDLVTVRGGIKFKSIHFLGAEYRNAGVKMELKDRSFSMQSESMEAYKGRMTASLDMGLKPAGLTYSAKAKMDKILIEEAVAIHLPEFKNDIAGAMVGSFSISGKGLRKVELEKNLRGQVSGQMKDGVLDIPLQKVLGDIVAKLPDSLKSKANQKISGQNFNGSFKTAKVESRIEGRALKIKNLDVVYDTQKGGLGDMRFQSNGTIDFDKNLDLLGTLFVTQKVINIGELKGKSGFVEIPLKLKGTMENPKPDVGYTTARLSERAAKNVAKKEVNKAKKKIEQEIKKKLPPKVQDKVNDLKKRFGF